MTSHFLSMLSTLEVGYPCRTRMLLAKMQDSNSWIRRHMRGMKQTKRKTFLPLRACTTLSFKQTPWFFGQPQMKLTQKWLCLWYDGMAYQDLQITIVVFHPFSCIFLPGLLGLFTGDPRAPKFPVKLWVRRHRRPLWNATPIISEEPWAALSELGLDPMTCTMLGRHGYGTVAAPFEFQSFLKCMLLKYSPTTEALLAFLEDKDEWNKRNWVIWRVWFFFACLYKSS